MLGRGARVLAIVIGLLGLLPAALAAPADVDILEAKFGLCDGLVPERWTPVRLTIASQREGFSGTLTITHAQDASQGASVTVPMATTPGVSTSVEVALCVPEDLTRLTFDFLDDATGRTRSIEYRAGGSSDGRGDVRDLPPPDSRGRRVVMVDADRSLIDAVKVRDPYSGLRSRDDPTRSNVWRGEVLPEHLPLSWVAYHSADVVVVPGDLGLRGGNRVDPRAMDALMAWVRSGGRLVVVVEPAGEGWKRFVDGAAVVDVGEVASIATPQRAAEVLSGGAPGSDVPTLFEKIGLGHANGVIAAAATLPARPIRLLPDGAHCGWTVEYSSESAHVLKDVDATGLVASGPVGHGTVMLVSFDPTKVPETLTSVGSSLLWQDVLSPMLVRERDRFSKESNNEWYGPRFRSSGGTAQEQASITRVLDEIANVPVFGHGLFIAIVGVTFVLAMLVGPIDAFVLRKRGWRQHSWLTALLWISIASLASLAAPSLIRSGENRMFRIAAYDGILGQKGEVVSACREGMMAVLPGRSGRLALRDGADGAVHRGVSSVAGQVREGLASSSLPLVQGTFGKGTLRGIVPVDAGVRQWSVRATMDESPSALTPALAGLNVEALWKDGWRVRLVGLPGGSNIRSMEMESVDGLWALGPAEAPGEWSSFAEPDRGGSAAWALADAEGSRGSYRNNEPRSALDFGIDHPGRTLSLPFAGTRRDAISRYVQSGSWACLCVQITSWPEDVAIDPKQRTDWNVQSQAVVRLLVPIERRSKVDPATHGAPTLPGGGPDEGSGDSPAEPSAKASKDQGTP